MVATDIGPSTDTTLTYVHDGARAVFHGVVDVTNLEIFRDFLSLLPSSGDVIVSIADLDLRVAEASQLLLDRARAIGDAGRLVLVASAR